MKVVFMGTPEFAVASLDAIVKHPKFEVVSVITAPDKPAGRGLKLQYSDVKKYAVEKNLPILQPTKLKDPQFLSELEALQADIFVVVAFRMLPKEVYAMPAKGCFNVHGSLLPQYRGAAPIHHAVINGEKETGVSTFFLNENIDTGDIILQKKTAILPNETTGELYHRLMELGAKAATETLEMIAKENVETQKQASSDADLKPAPKIFKENTRINWAQSGQDVHNFIRGMAPFPSAFTQIQNLKNETFSMKIYRSETTDIKSDNAPGTFEIAAKNEWFVNTNDNKIKIIELQFQGKSKVKTADFLNGFRNELFKTQFC